MKKPIIWLFAVIIILAALLAGPIMSNVGQAKYDVIETHGAIELRDYDPMIVAVVSVPGDRKKAISDGVPADCGLYFRQQHLIPESPDDCACYTTAD
jgi:hypothetical protein